MKKFTFTICVVCFFIYYLQVSNNDISNPKQEYQNGFDDGYKTCYSYYNLTKQNPVEPDQIFASAFAYGLIFKNSNRKKGYADGYCFATNELFVKKQTRKNTIERI